MILGNWKQGLNLRITLGEWTVWKVELVLRQIVEEVTSGKLEAGLNSVVTLILENLKRGLNSLIILGA